MAEDDWVITNPVDHTKIGSIPQKIRDVKSSTKVIIAKEHVTPTTDNAGGQHLKGSARVYLSDGFPAVDPEGNALDIAATTDDGRVAIDTTNENELRVYVGTSAGISTGFQHVRVGRVKAAQDLDANSHNIVSLASGTQTGQAIHVGQVDTTHFSIHEPATGAAVRLNLNTSFLATEHDTGLSVRAASLDSSVMTSAVVINAPSQITGALGTWESKSNNTAYEATTDGIVCAYTETTNTVIVGLTDGDNPPTTKRQTSNSGTVTSHSAPDASIMFPVKKGDYWKVTGADAVFWIPIGA